MPGRRRSRQRALQVLFLWDTRGIPIEDALAEFYRSLYFCEMEEETGDEVNLAPDADGFLEVLAKGTASKVEEIDELIRKRAENWRLDRMPKVDRTILRMAIYEMKDVGTPPPIVIDEALELARRYSEEEAVPFINGVLDSIRRMILPEEAERPAS